MSKRPKAVYIGKSTRHKASPCLSCGAIMDAATGIGNKAKPHAGAITLCVKCGHLMAYTWDMSLRELTDEEIVDIAGDERVLAIQRARAVYIAIKGKL
jgi:hypothetical protein